MKNGDVERTRGLFLGKFAPLHVGHEYVIRQALQQVEVLTVLIYEAPGLTSVPLSRRAEWIRNMDGRIEVIECPDGPTEVTYEPEGMRAHENYAKQQLGEREITHFFSSEPYGEHMSEALGAIDIRVDQRRDKFSVSATEIRKDIFSSRKSLSPEVYFDHIYKVVLLGAPSTGKSTLTEALAKEFGTISMPEYGREYWEKNNVERRLTEEQLVEIAEEHRKREVLLGHEANDFLFIDTNAITTLIFSDYYHGHVHKKLSQYADECVRRYDLVILCDEDIPYDDTEDRSGEDNRSEIQRITIQQLKDRGIEFKVVSGTVQERVDMVKNILNTKKESTK